MEKIILGIDPAITKKTAYGLWIGGSVLGSGFFEDLKQASKVIKQADHVYIESQYMKGNAQTLMKLSHSTGKLMGVCEVLDVPYDLVAPATWQSRVNFPGKRPKEINDYQWKKRKAAMLCNLAEDITGVVPRNDDEAAGILIAYSMGVLRNGLTD